MSPYDRSASEAARAAWLYFHEELSQGQIAQALGVSRSTVTRLLRRAKDEGLVRISLSVPSSTFQAERDLEHAYGLVKVRIVPEAADGAAQKRWLGHVAAEAIESLVTEGSIVAVSWGTTMQAMADALVGQTAVAGVRMVAMIGGLHNAELGTNTNDVARLMGERFGASVHPLLAPVYVQDEATALALANDPGIREAFELARRASLVVYSVGAMHDEATIFKLGHITAEQRGFLQDRRAVGEIACRWIDRDGRAVELPPSINPMGISLDDLKTIPRRLAVGGGKLKQPVLLAGLRGGFVTDLVTDEASAAELLKWG